MTVEELLSYFEDENLYVDVCMPSIRKCGSIKEMMESTNSFILNLSVSQWKLTEKQILEILDKLDPLGG